MPSSKEQSGPIPRSVSTEHNNRLSLLFSTSQPALLQSMNMLGSNAPRRTRTRPLPQSSATTKPAAARQDRDKGNDDDDNEDDDDDDYDGGGGGFQENRGVGYVRQPKEKKESADDELLRRRILGRHAVRGKGNGKGNSGNIKKLYALDNEDSDDDDDGEGGRGALGRRKVVKRPREDDDDQDKVVPILPPTTGSKKQKQKKKQKTA